MAQPPTDNTGTLRIEYETDQLLPAADVATMLKEVANSFERYAKRRGRGTPFRLAVKRIEVSSLLAELVVMGVATAHSAFEHRDAIYGFLGFVADTLSIAKGLKKGKVKAADIRMIEALQKPVAQGGAQQVNLFVVGDGNTVTIDREAIRLIYAQREQELVAADGYQTKVLAQENFPSQVRQPRLLTLEGKFGTVFDVRGQWYVRLEGEGGVLNPLELEHGVAVKDGQTYQFDGVWDDRRYRIRVARPMSA